MDEKQLLTQDMYLKGDFVLDEPRALSFSNKEYYAFVRKLNMISVMNLSEILLHPKDELFTQKNWESIYDYHLEIGGKEYGLTPADYSILYHIKKGNFDKNLVLHDIIQLLTKHDPEKLELRVNAYNHLIKEGLVSISENEEQV